MTSENFNKLLLVVIALGVWILVLQGTGMIPRLKPSLVLVTNTVPVSNSTPTEVWGSVDIGNLYSAIELASAMDVKFDVNVSAIAGRDLFQMRDRASFGFEGRDGLIYPIDWGWIDARTYDFGRR